MNIRTYDRNVYADLRMCVCVWQGEKENKIEQEYTEHKIQREEQYKRQQQKTITKREEEESVLTEREASFPQNRYDTLVNIYIGLWGYGD